MSSGRPRKDIKSVAKSPVTWLSLVLLGAAGAVVVGYVREIKREKAEEKDKENKKHVGMASLGGPFSLTDHDGKAVTNADFHGKWVMIYFGFCHCPDICPDILDKMSLIIEKVTDENAVGTSSFQPLFISVDPKRDTIPIVKEYLKDFNPTIIGLVGTEEQTKEVCKAYRVYYSMGPTDEDEDYIVDHTVIMYLLAPDGSFSDYFGQNAKVDEIVTRIRTKMLKGV